jgi:hypothetical protein
VLTNSPRAHRMAGYLRFRQVRRPRTGYDQLMTRIYCHCRDRQSLVEKTESVRCSFFFNSIISLKVLQCLSVAPCWLEDYRSSDWIRKFPIRHITTHRNRNTTILRRSDNCHSLRSQFPLSRGWPWFPTKCCQTERCLKRSVS